MTHILEKLNRPQMWRDRQEEHQRLIRVIKLCFWTISGCIVLITLVMAGVR